MNPGEIPWSSLVFGPVLSFMIAIPLLAAATTLPTHSPRTISVTGLGIALLEFFLALYVLFRFQQGSAATQMAERGHLLGLIPYHLGVDGMNILFLPLATGLTLMLMLYAYAHPREEQGKLVACLLAIESACLGMLTTLNLLHFSVFALGEVLLINELIRHWGTGLQRLAAAKQYLHFMRIGFGLLFTGICILVWIQAIGGGNTISLDIEHLLALKIPRGQQVLVLFCLFFGLGVLLPIVPLHGWLPTIAEQGPVVFVLALLSGLKLGIYALLRFVLPLLPAAVQSWSAALVWLGIIGMFYGAILALAQINLRRLLAYAIVSHTSALLVGVFSTHHSAWEGALLLALNLGLASAGLCLIVGFVYRRTGTAFMPRLGGVYTAAPLLGLSFLVASLSSTAMPGTPGFDAAHLVITGSLEVHSWIVALLWGLGNVLAAAYLLWAYQRVFLLWRERQYGSRMTSLQPSEIIVAIAICAALFGVGLNAEPWIKFITPSIAELAVRYQMLSIAMTFTP